MNPGVSDFLHLVKWHRNEIIANILEHMYGFGELSPKQIFEWNSHLTRNTRTNKKHFDYLRTLIPEFSV